MLCAGFLSVRSGVVSGLHTLCPKRFILDALSVRNALNPWVGEKKIKKKKGGKKFFLGGRKKYSLASFGLCGCLVRLARVYFFCVVAVFLFVVIKILFAGANFLLAGTNFLSDVAYFLFADLNCQRAVENFGLSGWKSEKAKGSFAFAGRNSLCDAGNLLSDVGRLRLLHFLKLQFAHLFELWACCTENGFHIFLYITCNVHKSACCCIKNAVTGNP